MNETLSLLLATAVLTVGGFGLMFYKTVDEEGETYDEDEIFNKGKDKNEKPDKNEKLEKLEKNEKPDKNEYKENSDNEELESFEPKVRSRGSKSKRNRKTTGTKRRYYY